MILMSEPVPNPTPSPEQILSQMDALLAKGRKAIAKHEAFMAEHQLFTGIGARELTGPRVPEPHREIFRHLIYELEHMRERIQEFDEQIKLNKKNGSAAPVQTRSLNHRYRI